MLAIGNIHAGEVDGKEALPMLARELLAEDSPLLREMVLVLAPIYNADGNERVSPDNRPGQLGPERGMGIRENASALDLNRDYVKLDAAETRALVALLNEWDPAAFIDTHPTNGSFHRYVLTYEGPKTPAGDAQVIRYARDEMLPAIARIARQRSGIETFVYGDFDAGHQRWESYPATARFGTSYVGLRSRLTILTEGYSYAPYRDRVLATRDFVRASLEFIREHRAAIRGLLRNADERTTSLGRRGGDDVAIRTRAVAAPGRQRVAGFVEELRDGRPVSTGEPRDYEVEMWTHYEATLTVPRPAGYIVPAECADVLERLRLHGVRMSELPPGEELRVEVYTLTDVKVAERPFQKRLLHTFEAERSGPQRREAPVGAMLVTTAQPLGSLAVYLLEPQCEDGLATWGFFADLKAGDEFPVWRVPRP